MAAPTLTYPYINSQLSDGPEVAQDLNDLLNAITDGTKDLTANSITLTNFAQSPIFRSNSANIASIGIVRLSNSDAIDFRNSANSGNLAFTTGSSDAIPSWNGIDLVNLSTSQTLTNKSMSGASNTFTNIGDGSLSTSYVKADGTRALTGNWNAGAFQITANSVQVGSSANTISQLSTIVNTGTLTLPTSTDTLVGRATTDTLTNKTISGSSNTLSNIADGSLSTSYIKADGSRALTANWGAGNFQITINSILLGSASKQISQCQILNSDGSLTLGTNGSTAAITIDTFQNATFAASAILPTSGGTATGLNYYEEGSFTANFNAGAGAGGSGTSFTVKFIRIGKLVTLSFPNMTTMTTGAASQAISTASGTIPTRIRPVAGLYCMFLASNAGTTANSTCNIEANGAIDLFLNPALTGGNWTVGANEGAFPFSVTYAIN